MEYSHAALTYAGRIGRSGTLANAQSFVSPNSLTETCRILAPIPGGDFSDKDRKQEARLCAIDFYSPSVALCPKNISTSAGVYLYDISSLTGITTAEYESKHCGQEVEIAGKKLEADKLGKFKVTMNQSGTSGTTSTSSLLYYQFSRLLDTLIDIPVSVQRTIDKDVMDQRVAAKSAGKSKMNREAWKWIRAAAARPESYSPTDDLFTADRKQFYGIILKDSGDRYGAEINSERKAGWGAPQVREFQTTPAFLALRSRKPIAEAVAGAPYSAAQMVHWMRELSEIAVLDYIFSQQDRVGNIDFQFHWYWIDAKGDVTHRKADTKNIDKKDLTRADMKSIVMPEDIKAFNPVLIQRSILADNDAGGNPRYANFAKKTEMVDGLRHFNAGEYRKLQEMVRDFKSNGPILQHLTSEFGLTAKQLKMVVDNTVEVAGILKANCQAGKLKFDLNPARFFTGDSSADVVDCEGI